MLNHGLPLHVDTTKRYRYNSYWGNWSRILQFPIWYSTDRRHLDMIEFSITPINGLHGDWEDLSRIMIRKHGTSFNAKDEFSNTISMDWYEILGEKLGEERRDFMMFDNFDLNKIDWQKYHKINNGGASWFDIQKE